MSKGIIVFVLVILVVLAGALWYLNTDTSSVQNAQNSKEANPASFAPVNEESSPASGPSSQEKTPEKTEESVHEISISAKRFEFTPSVIRVKQGEHIKLTLTSADTQHGIALPDFNAQGRDIIEFVANKKGTFTFYCNTYCGSGHSEMKGTLVVE